MVRYSTVPWSRSLLMHPPHPSITRPMPRFNFENFELPKQWWLYFLDHTCYVLHACTPLVDRFCCLVMIITSGVLLSMSCHRYRPPRASERLTPLFIACFFSTKISGRFYFLDYLLHVCRDILLHYCTVLDGRRRRRHFTHTHMGGGNETTVATSTVPLTS